MELTDLTENERVALVALLEEIIAADAEVTDEEPERLAEVIEAIGEETYGQAVEEAAREHDRGSDLQALLEGVRKREARELIFGTALEVAMANAITPEEAPILDWLAMEWGIEDGA
jgi:hypothetical protein